MKAHSVEGSEEKAFAVAVLDSADFIQPGAASL